MLFIYLIIFFVLVYMSVCFRVAIFHPFKVVFNGIVDLYFYFRHKNYNYYQAGKLNCYCAHFGGGKTLSIAHFATVLYKKYNNKKVWDRGKKKFVTQKFLVLSNVELKHIPYQPLTGLSQIVDCARHNADIDKENNTRTVVLVILDEASVQLNSRAFKTNIDPIFLNTLLTSRHYHISMYYSSQKFKLTDALLRSVTQRCVECEKIWRFMILRYYNADEVENASNPLLIKPIKRRGFFITNYDYGSYDTLACVDNLKKSMDDGDFMSEEEILALRGDMGFDNDAITHRSRKFKKLRKN